MVLAMRPGMAGGEGVGGLDDPWTAAPFGGDV
jgi:hypothetical protein